MQQHFVNYCFYSIQWICFVHEFLLRLPLSPKKISMSILRLCRICTGKDEFCCIFGATNPEDESSSYGSAWKKYKIPRTDSYKMHANKTAFFLLLLSIHRQSATRTLVESKTSKHKVGFLEYMCRKILPIHINGWCVVCCDFCARCRKISSCNQK